jgi:hypothetical protein
MDSHTLRPSWWSRNRKWAVPVIVLAGMVLAAVPVLSVAQIFLRSGRR